MVFCLKNKIFTTGFPDILLILILDKGSECLIPGVPAARSSVPTPAVRPIHHVLTGGRTNCMESYTAIAELNEPSVDEKNVFTSSFMHLI